ncbi:MAG TPA: porin [Bacteroidales bacterium]|nr:porin [Bacteroidales bacterium]
MYKTGKKEAVIIFIVLSLISPFRLTGQESSGKMSEYIPDIDVILKTKLEHDLDNSLMRFEVRNARFGLRGKINEKMSYRTQLDLSDEGQMKMLDAYIRFTPVKNLDFYLGQRKIPFSTDYMRNPAENIFANRSFLSKYINNGLRDIGFFASYKFSGTLPLEIIAGAVNGTGNNNPQWISRPNFAGRILVGNETGFRTVLNAYYGEAPDKIHLAMFGAEFRYASESFLIESEYISRNWTDTLSFSQHDDGLYIHSYYHFPVRNELVKMITPVFRWDFTGSSIFSNNIDVNRLTIGFNTGFDSRPFYSEIRLNYENYFRGTLPIHTDKLTLEFIARF